MDFKHVIEDEICILNLSGELISRNIMQLENYLRPMCDQPDFKGMIIDFSDVAFVDSSGIGLLVTQYKFLERRNLAFGICCLNSENRELFHITRMDQVVRLFETLQEAKTRLFEKTDDE